MAVAQVGARSVTKPRSAALPGAGAANAKLQVMRTTVGLSALVLGLSALVYACGAGDLSSFGAEGKASTNPGADAGAFGAGAAPETSDANGPVDNAVILVHAAKSQAFRLCFKNELDRRPQPDSQVMPEANVVGVEVGSAVRLPPLRGAPGEVFLFEEPAIRVFYPTFGGAGEGQSCDELLQGEGTKGLAVSLGTIGTDLAHGVHLLVVHGCPGKNNVRNYSVQECGASWNETKGNLSVKEIALQGAMTQTDGILPAQVVNLSQPLESARGAQDLVVTFGDLGQPRAQHLPVVTNPSLLGGAEPAQLAYDSKDTAVYESFGFRVSFTAAGGTGDAASDTKVLDESLAQVQKQSSPREVPPSYYATASNYALLLLGDPNAKLVDGGPDTDERRSLHFLAVPVVEPKSDGGAEGGTTDLDGGAAPTP